MEMPLRPSSAEGGVSMESPISYALFLLKKRTLRFISISGNIGCLLGYPPALDFKVGSPWHSQIQKIFAGLLVLCSYWKSGDSALSPSQVILVVSWAIHQHLILKWDLHDTLNSRRHLLDSLCSVLTEKAEPLLYLQSQVILVVTWAIHQLFYLKWDLHDTPNSRRYLLDSLFSVLTEKVETLLYLQSQVILIVFWAIHQLLILKWDLHDTANSRRHWLEPPCYLQSELIWVVLWAIHQLFFLMWDLHDINSVLNAKAERPLISDLSRRRLDYQLRRILRRRLSINYIRF
jgi:hypothetical protein